MTLTLPPLNDPAYVPVHPPIDGGPPEVVAKWGAASQLRWFERFWRSGELRPLTAKDLEPFHCHSAEHTGACCESCIGEKEEDYHYTDSCCCRALRDVSKTVPNEPS